MIPSAISTASGFRDLPEIKAFHFHRSGWNLVQSVDHPVTHWSMGPPLQFQREMRNVKKDVSNLLTATPGRYM
ncbi:MAG: hypothetical protein EA399_07780 [Desulfovibrionales bacterium]|nr:MAG: hypothetical protein EA399_07780 [Desulfovibrionales bacterium]